MNILKQIKYFFKSFNVNLNKSFLLAISGGVDSMCLLDLFIKLNIKIGIGHCNFDLREDSKKEQDFIENLNSHYKQYNFKIFSTKFDTLEYVKKNNKSIQMGARELRYNWLSYIASKKNYHYIVTAHHLNDNIETVLLNFFKGTGISGLRGIPPKINDYYGNINSKISLIRPLLYSKKEDILEYATANSIKWKEDYTNKRNFYKRNFVRNCIVPKIKELNPNFESTFLLNNKRLTSLEKLAIHETEKIKKKILISDKDKIILKYNSIKDIFWKNIILYDILKEYNFNYMQVEQIINKPRERGKIFYSKSHELIYDRNLIIIPKADKEHIADEYMITKDLQKIALQGLEIKFDIINNVNFKFKTTYKQVHYIDYDKLDFPLKIRKWKNGDRFNPLGMKGTQKLKEYFINNKVSIFEKRNIFILISKNEIVAILNFQISEKFKIESSTKKIFKINITILK